MAKWDVKFDDKDKTSFIAARLDEVEQKLRNCVAMLEFLRNELGEMAQKEEDK